MTESSTELSDDTSGDSGLHPSEKWPIDQSSARREPSRRLVFGIVAMALVMGTVDATIVPTALPTIHENLRASINWAGWTITIYGLGLVIAAPIAGKFCDRFGRRRVFLCAVALFTSTSLLCGFATDIYMLIVFRGFQALGGGAFIPSATGIVADHFGRDRDRAIGMFGTITASGQVAGPVLGGILVGFLSWRWIFFVNVPTGIALFCLTTKFIPESRLLATTKTDIRGLVLMASLILAAIFGITSLGSGHTAIDAPIVLAPELCALGLVCLFIRHTKRVAEPFIPMRLLRNKGFAAMNTVNMLFGVVSFGVASLVPLYAEQRYRLHTLNAGTLLTARAVGLIAVGTIAALSLRRTGYRLPMVIGFVTIACGMCLMSIAPRWGMSPYAWLSISAGITGLGGGSVNPAMRNACLQAAPDAIAAVTGLRNMFNNLGVIFGVAITTAILNRSATPGITQAHIYWVAAGILLFVMIPLVFRVPEHKGSW